MPLHESSVVALRRYLTRRQRAHPGGDHVFVSNDAQPLAYGQVHAVFRKLLKSADLLPSRGRGPRLHELRHTFAVRALESTPDGRKRIGQHREAFLREHLARHRGASQHTCDSYAYSFQSLFEFAAHKLKAAPSALMLEQLDATLICGFLEHLETTRRNSAETRNIRLAAIRSFFRFLQHREPAALEQIRRILAIPFKKTDTRLVGHLNREEVQALLDAS